MATISVTHLKQSATLTIQKQWLEVTLDDNTIVYPFKVIYGIRYDATLSTLTIDCYLTPASLQDDDIQGQKPVDTLGNHTLEFKIDTWTTIIEETIQTLQATVVPKRQTRIYPFLNPTSGNQMAKQSWTKIVQPMLQSAGFTNFSPVIETKADQVRQQAFTLGKTTLQEERNKDILILCLGGDGTLHDLINGLMDSLPTDKTLRPFRLGVIPAGSGNAFALSLNLHPQDIGHAVLRLIHGQPRPFHLLDIDIGTTTNDDDWSDHVTFAPTKQQRRVFVVVSWGFHAQILAKSRYLRYIMGNKRFSLVAMALLLFLYHYKGDVVMKRARRYDRQIKSFVPEEITTTTLSSHDSRGGFTYFLATKQASLEPGFTITPFASPFEQDMDVLCMRQATADQLKTVAGLAFQGGKHVDHEAVDYYKTNELYLRVHEATDICLDGELLPVRAMDVIRIQSIQDPTKKDAFIVLV